MGIHLDGSGLHVAVVISAYLVALAAAARSTWSPCGLSMLSSITPLGERGRGQRFGATASWFVAGAAIGGLVTGAGMAALAWAVRNAGLTATWGAGLAAGVLVLGAAGDLGLLGFRIPLLPRQVNERWLDQYRPWVYGAGFGWQIGTGLATYIMTTAVFATIAVAALTGSPLVAASVGLVFGLARGLVVLAGREITTPEALRRVHRRFDAWRQPVWLGVAIIQAALGAALAGLAWVPSLVVVAAAAGTVSVVLTRTPLRRLATPG
jgi:MFS family permease